MLNKFDIDFLEKHTQFYSKLTKEDKELLTLKLFLQDIPKIILFIFLIEIVMAL